MNRENKKEINASNYETYMKRAYQKYDLNKVGISCHDMINLIDAENGESWVKHLGSAEKQLNQLKKYMTIGMDKYLKMGKIPNENKNKLLMLKKRIENAYSSNDLIEIVNRTLDLTEMVK